ncbi:PQQ-binding-like beta-propeller repeat protein [Williamsia sp. CHRR-6]|uniref:outer membrane protein assembly factor BamB family protein n=1 Tax=Williamsia sp. CHRR-6 TaxID=2835871 RepID=UPI001BD9C191|nr:PQQ-binding-like beta-propeller repeat protein [Williamsia sp. CHRR-6]MBT0565478.1 PQQ-binding-like beta-propeller repeat protein [Williamsia sp. CHRR-6]
MPPRIPQLPTRPSGTGRRRRGAVLLLAGAVLATACTDGQIDVRSVAAAGWSSFGGNALNSNFAYPASPKDLTLSWSRPTGGPITAPVTISGRYNVGVTSATANGCNTFIFDPRAGRKTICRRMGAGVELDSMLTDQYDNTYLGEAGTFYSYNAGGTVRWRVPTIGLAVSAKFAAPELVLVATTQGQLMLINTQTGRRAAPDLVLRAETFPDQPKAGLGDCVTARPNCPIAASPAVDDRRERFYLNYWPQNSLASEVRALEYGTVRGTRVIRSAWTTPIAGGVIGTPTLSADRATLYVFDRIGNIHALATDTGKPRWSFAIGSYGFGTMSVSPDGLIIPTGVIGAPLTAIRDRSTKAEIAWQRNDLQIVSLSTLTSAATAWTVTRVGPEQRLELTEVSAKDGSTRRALPMPGAVGFATGVAVAPGGEIATATNLGEVYYFDRPAKNRD